LLKKIPFFLHLFYIFFLLTMKIIGTNYFWHLKVPTTFIFIPETIPKVEIRSNFTAPKGGNRRKTKKIYKINTFIAPFRIFQKLDLFYHERGCSDCIGTVFMTNAWPVTLRQEGILYGRSSRSSISVLIIKQI